MPLTTTRGARGRYVDDVRQSYFVSILFLFSFFENAENVCLRIATIFYDIDTYRKTKSR